MDRIENQDEKKQELLKRLARIRGQVDGIGRMIEQRRDTSEVLQQLAAARSALLSAESVLLEAYVERAVTTAIEDGDATAEAVSRQLARLVRRHMR